MPDTYLARRAGCSMVKSGDGLRLVSRETGHRLSLNRTAALTWLLCDGSLRHREAVARVQELYPGREPEVETETHDLLDELEAGGWIRRRAVASERPVLRVAFRGFWEGFDPGDNYLVWMLSFRYDVLVVEETSIPDLLFFRPGDAPTRWDRERTLGVSCAAAGDPRPEPTGDFALLWDGPDGDRQLGLPSWVLEIDWRWSRDGHPGEAERAGYSPHRFGERFVAALEQQAGRWSRGPETTTVAKPAAEPPPTRRERRPRLTVGMATYDDYDGVYFTVQALVLYHPELAADLEILIVDNHPEGADASALQGLAAVPGARYLAFTELRGTAVRDVIFRHARAPIVLCLDPHVLVPPGALLRLVEHVEARPSCGDLFQGPLLYDDHVTLSTHFEPIWSAGMFGVWQTDDRGRDPDGPPFEIPMQGLGLFACRRQAWPGFNPRFRGFGGEEGYLHEKFRRRGGRALCLPFLRWLHRFQRPRGLRYDNTWEDRIRNYLIGHHELGQATAGLESHFRTFLGDEIYERAEAATDVEMASPFWRFDAVYGIGLEDEADRRRFASECHGIGLDKLLRWPAPRTATVPRELRYATAHRQILKGARRLGLDSVLLIDCRDKPRDPALAALTSVVAKLDGRPWQVLTFDAGEAGPPWAVAYHHRVYRTICEDLPAEPEPMAAKLEACGGTFRSYLESSGVLDRPLASGVP